MNDTAQLDQTAEMHGSNQHLAQQSAAPLVSIIIPCHNQARFLSDAIASVQGQTHSPVELIVVDDGSPDNTAEIARRYEAIRYLRQENRSVPTARNAGFSASTGAYVMFLDADDRLTPNAVQEHLRCFADHPEAGFVVGDIDQIHEDGSYKDSPRWPILRSNFYGELLKVNHVANTIAVMFRRSVLEQLGGFDTSGDGGEDYELLLRSARSFPSAHHSTVVAQYRRYPSSRSQQGVRMLRAMRRIMRSQRTFVRGNAALEAACRKGEAYWRYHYGVTTIKEIIAHLCRGDLLRATKAFSGLLWYVRGRLLLVPWKERRRIWKFLQGILGSGRYREVSVPAAEHSSPFLPYSDSQRREQDG